MASDATTLTVVTEIPVLELKREILEHAQKALKKTLAEAKARAEDAREAATHEENKPENDKDMRSTEASYIARGMAERIADMERGLAKLISLEVRAFQDKPIAVSALVTLALGGAETQYLLVAEPGGITVDVRGDKYATLATTSPLGRALLGQSEGDEVTAGPKKHTYEIVSVR
jgi:transcription elongation GreA/GreB family factor